MTTLAQLRQSVRNRIGIPSDDGLQRDEVIDDNINQAIATIEAEHRWPWNETVATLTVTGGTGTATLPDDWQATRALIYDGIELVYKTRYDPSMIREPVTGDPTYYTIVNRTVTVSPRPGSDLALTHLYYTAPSVLTDNDSSPSIPDVYSPAIVAKAAHLLAIREDDRAAAGAHLIEYQEWLARLRRETDRVTRTKSPHIRPGNWV